MPEKVIKSCFPPELDDFIDLSEKLGEGMMILLLIIFQSSRPESDLLCE